MTSLVQNAVTTSSTLPLYLLLMRIIYTMVEHAISLLVYTRAFNQLFYAFKFFKSVGLQHMTGCSNSAWSTNVA